jgi:hypothetical protein
MKAQLLSVLLSLVAASCKGIQHSGLQTVHPAVDMSPFALEASFVPVESLQPTFEWEELTRNPWGLGESPPLEAITYELRVWTYEVTEREREVYSVVGLPRAEHKVAVPLPAGTRLLWSVRAHFEVSGRPRVSEWALVGRPLRAEVVPNRSCPRFRTPTMEELSVGQLGPGSQ